LLLVLLALAMINVWRPVVGAGGRVALAIAISTLCVIGLGHMLGGPSPSGRTSLAVACAARNAGLALVVAFANSASPEIMAAVLAYLVVSALTATPYVVWRSRAASGVRRAGTPRDFGDSGDSRE